MFELCLSKYTYNVVFVCVYINLYKIVQIAHIDHSIEHSFYLDNIKKRNQSQNFRNLKMIADVALVNQLSTNGYLAFYNYPRGPIGPVKSVSKWRLTLYISRNSSENCLVCSVDTG